MKAEAARAWARRRFRLLAFAEGRRCALGAEAVGAVPTFGSGAWAARFRALSTGSVFD
jgi:hypothetical protein